MQPIDYIKAFLTGYLAWAKGQPVDGVTYSPAYGLCGNLTDFLVETVPYREAHSHEVLEDIRELRKAVRRLLADRLIEKCGDDEYPFGADRYVQDCSHGSHHELPERLEFVREWIDELNAE